MQALGDAVIIKPVNDDSEKKIGSLFIPGTVSEKISQGEVISLGRGTVSGGGIIPPEIEVGDIVLYNNSVKIPIEIDGNEHFIVQGMNIFCKK